MTSHNKGSYKIGLTNLDVHLTKEIGVSRRTLWVGISTSQRDRDPHASVLQKQRWLFTHERQLALGGDQPQETLHPPERQITGRTFLPYSQRLLKVVSGGNLDYVVGS